MLASSALVSQMDVTKTGTGNGEWGFWRKLALKYLI